jgi:hypothetical protein
MSRFDLNNNHPIIPNSNQYYFEKKYISIHSEDRDVNKYRNPSSFEIELPQDYLNVQSARLYSWSFPANYSVFSTDSHNVYMTFKFIKLYNPGEHAFSDPLTEAIFAGLYYNISTEYTIVIEPGFYNPTQMATELTNKMNEVITVYLNGFFASTDPLYTQYNYAAALFTTYDRFIVVYNDVGQKLWFGNNADQFVLTNDSNTLFKKDFLDQKCAIGRRGELPNFTDFGLPAFLGFTRCNSVALPPDEYLLDPKNSDNTDNVDIAGNTLVPRFYYGDVTGTGDNGYWLLPVLPQATVYYLQAPLKINFMGPAYIYMEIEGLNCIDETIPYNLSPFTTQTNQTNGIVNSSFAKIPVPTTPISQWFDNDMGPYKYFNPPAERIRKLKIKFRYHNNVLVDFGSFDFSFMLEFCLLKPQNERKYNIRDAFSLSQVQGV